MKNIKPNFIEAKFRRSKLMLDKTKLWKTIDILKQQVISSKINLEYDEKELICFYNYDYWWLFTTKNLIVNDNKSLLYISLFEISKIDLPANIKNINHPEAYIDIYFQDKKVKLQLEKFSWPIMIEILKFVTPAKIIIK
ncbi:hypothetical protein [Chryseobacterium sp. PMSZPI]|uniref:hypothetical protein n=1 Tax=Chryseobacterium sp. PMSZPI TaxID=1033900 RepID=UPI000C3384BB|nr:hypothetical protein [Chryseobacterium sp. PMSZPI]PKF74192.1 hypothetical protein CW752_09685 [Chryseobacterium sp. PMSZPI]